MFSQLKKGGASWVFSSVSLTLASEWKQDGKRRKSKSSVGHTVRRRRHGGSPAKQKLSLD